MGIFCGARKSFLEFSLRVRIQTEPFDLQQEMANVQLTAQQMFSFGNGPYNLRKEIPVVDYCPPDLTNM
jgi:hypothetical protein